MNGTGVRGRKESLLYLLFLCETGKKGKTLFGTGLRTAAAEDTAELFKIPLLGLPGHFDGIGRTLSGTHSAEDALILFNDQFAPFSGEGFTLDCGIVSGHRSFDQIADDIFEYGKQTHFNAPCS